jgi:hypothetical protein
MIGSFFPAGKPVQRGRAGGFVCTGEAPQSLLVCAPFTASQKIRSLAGPGSYPGRALFATLRVPIFPARLAGWLGPAVSVAPAVFGGLPAI